MPLAGCPTPPVPARVVQWDACGAVNGMLSSGASYILACPPTQVASENIATVHYFDDEITFPLGRLVCRFVEQPARSAPRWLTEGESKLAVKAVHGLRHMGAVGRL